MHYRTIQPTGKLASFVRSFWTLEGTVSKDQPYIHRTMACHCPELIFHYKGLFEQLSYDSAAEKSFRTGIHAQTTLHRRFIVKENFGIFGVFLEPFAIPALFQIPATEIKNELPDLRTLLGREGDELDERMMLANDNHERLQLITQFLERRLTDMRKPEIIHAAKAIYRSHGQLTIRDLASEVCLSQRQFERNFKEMVGFTPKLFSRLVRFRALLNVRRTDVRTLAEIAYDFGYYDQAHFIQDFREFSGYNPKTYFSGEASEILYA